MRHGGVGFFQGAAPQRVLDAYHDAWRFWGDADYVFGLTFDQLAEVLRQALRIAEAEAKAARESRR